MSKSEKEIIDELIDEKQKALIQIRAQRKSHSTSFSSFGISPYQINSQVVAAEQLEAEITELRRMSGEIDEVVGTREEIQKYLSCKSDNSDNNVYRLIKLGKK